MFFGFKAINYVHTYLLRPIFPLWRTYLIIAGAEEIPESIAPVLCFILFNTRIYISPLLLCQLFIMSHFFKPFILSATPRFLYLKPPTLPPSSLYRSHPPASAIIRAKAMRFSNLLPVHAAAENGGASNGAASSASATNDFDGNLSFLLGLFILFGACCFCFLRFYSCFFLNFARSCF